MADQHINVNIDQMKILSPVIAAELTTAFYLHAVLRQLKGDKWEDVMSESTFTEVNATWMDIWKHLDLVSKGPKE